MFSDNNISGEITVSCYDSVGTKLFLEEASRLFEMKYPNTKIDVPGKKAIFTDGRFASMLESVIDYGDLGYLALPSNTQDSRDRVMYKVNPSRDYIL